MTNNENEPEINHIERVSTPDANAKTNSAGCLIVFLMYAVIITVCVWCGLGIGQWLYANQGIEAKKFIPAPHAAVELFKLLGALCAIILVACNYLKKLKSRK